MVLDESLLIGKMRQDVITEAKEERTLCEGEFISPVLS